MKKILTAFALAATAIFGMYACNSTSSAGGGGGGGDSTFIMDFYIDVLTAPSGASGTMVTREIDNDCEDNVAVADTSIDTSFYAVTGGKLYLWDDPLACYAQQLSGSSTTGIGTWTASATSPEVEIPAPYKPAGCTGTLDTSGDGEFGGLFEDGTVTYDVSSTKIHAKISGTVCFAELFSEEFADPVDGITVTNAGCSTVELKNADNAKTLTISTAIASNTITMSYKSGTATCTMSGALSVPGTIPDCSKPEFGEADSTFEACFEDLEFFQPALAKRSADMNLKNVNSEISKRIGKSLRSFRTRH